MSRCILDQNGVITLSERVKDIGEIVISPMFMWELFNNTDSPIENRIIQLLKPAADRLAITFKSVTAEANELKDIGVRPTQLTKMK